jgi:hypothetical protein
MYIQYNVLHKHLTPPLARQTDRDENSEKRDEKKIKEDETGVLFIGWGWVGAVRRREEYSFVGMFLSFACFHFP